MGISLGFFQISLVVFRMKSVVQRYTSALGCLCKYSKLYEKGGVYTQFWGEGENPWPIKVHLDEVQGPNG